MSNRVSLGRIEYPAIDFVALAADKLKETYEGISLPEIAALNNITLTYADLETSEGKRGVLDGCRHVVLNQNNARVENERQFFNLLATFIIESE